MEHYFILVRTRNSQRQLGKNLNMFYFNFKHQNEKTTQAYGVV